MAVAAAGRRVRRGGLCEAHDLDQEIAKTTPGSTGAPLEADRANLLAVRTPWWPEAWPQDDDGPGEQKGDRAMVDRWHRLGYYRPERERRGHGLGEYGIRGVSCPKVDILIVGAGPAGCADRVGSRWHAPGYSVALCEAPRARAPLHLGEIARPGRLTEGAEFRIGIGVVRAVVRPRDRCRLGRSGGADRQTTPFNENLRRPSHLRGRAVSSGDASALRSKAHRQDAGGSPPTAARSIARGSPTPPAALPQIARRLGARRIAFDRRTATTVTWPPVREAHAAPGRGGGERLVVLRESPGARNGRDIFHGPRPAHRFRRCPLRQSRCAGAFLPARAGSRSPNILAAGTTCCSAPSQATAGSPWGDAAWSCDPLSSSGIGNAFRSASWALEGMADYADRVAEEFAIVHAELPIRKSTVAQGEPASSGVGGTRAVFAP